MILFLPSITYFIDSIVKQTFNWKTLPTALTLPLVVVYRAIIWFLDPRNNMKRDKFWELKIHEVAYESLMQLLLQIHVFLHYGFQDVNNEPMTAWRKANLIGSLLSSFLNSWYGMNTHWIQNQFGDTHIKETEKIKLMFTTVGDLIARLLFMMTIFASIHGLGFLVIFYLYICQPILMFNRHPQIEATFDIRRLFNPIFHQNDTKEIKVVAQLLLLA